MRTADQPKGRYRTTTRAPCGVGFRAFRDLAEKLWREEPLVIEALGQNGRSGLINCGTEALPIFYALPSAKKGKGRLTFRAD